MPRTSDQVWNLKDYFLILLGIWTLTIAVPGIFHWRGEQERIVSEALIQARSLYQRDLDYMQWSSDLGGVYIPLDEHTLPNPLLNFLPERDVTTRDGRRLTLVNPAFLAQQVHAAHVRNDRIRERLTGFAPMNPKNLPDPWETKGLQALQRGAAEFSGVEVVDGREALRLLAPYSAVKSCLRCHADQGYREGKLLGGVSLSVPLAPLQAADRHHQLMVVGGYGAIWLLGATLLLWGTRRLHRQILSVSRHARELGVAEESIKFLTNFDPVTGLPNRHLLEDRLTLALAHAQRLQERVAVVELGVNNLKEINGSFGHAAGDRLLREVADQLTGCLRPDDSVGRWGANRFLLLLPCLRQAEDAATVLEKARQSLEEPVWVEGVEIFLKVSAGIALFPEDGRDTHTLLRNAESALNQSQGTGEGDFQFFTPALQSRAVERLALDAALRRALDLGQLEVVYQPQVDGADRRLIGAEALLRWHHPELGTISPNVFIPLAEDSGSILAIGRFVLETACRQVVAWRQATGRPLRMAVNFSARQFHQPDLVEMIEEVLKTVGLEPNGLEVEITEGTLIKDFDLTVETLTDLKIRGIGIAVDDFGTGYSSLSYLVKFPIDRLKIDRSFISDLEKNPDSQNIIGSIVDLAERMGIELIAEGVETSGQRNFLLGNGCRYMQGFFFGRPVGVADFAVLLAQA